MKITFDIADLVPRYILKDKNGWALAKAIEAGMKYVAKAAEDGIDTIMNPDKMPEWRLDELAKELNILYLYEADIEDKREWIKNAYNSYRIYGTAEGVRQYLKIYFSESSITEFWEFSGDPFKFDVAVTGVRSDENEAWIRAAVAKAKNVRSELRNIIYNGGESEAELECAIVDVGVSINVDCVMY